MINTIAGGGNSHISAGAQHEKTDQQQQQPIIASETAEGADDCRRSHEDVQVMPNGQNNEQRRQRQQQPHVAVSAAQYQAAQSQPQQQYTCNAYNTPTYLHTQPDFIPTFTDLLPPPPKPDEAEKAEEAATRPKRITSQHVYNPSYALSLLSVTEFTLTAIPHPFDVSEPADLQPVLEVEFRSVLEEICREYCFPEIAGDKGDGGTSQNSPSASVKAKNAPVFDDGKWRIPLGAYRSFHSYLTAKKGRARVEGIPEAQLKVATLGRERMDRSYPTVEDLVGRGVPAGLAGALAPYQRGGVDFCLERGGRALIGDEMGLGKTVQAIATMSCFEKDWPLLVLCPSSARYHWEAEFRQWLGKKSSINSSNAIDGDDGPLKKRPRVVPTASSTTTDASAPSSSMQLLRNSEICVLNSSSDDTFTKPNSRVRVVICSYGLVLNLVSKNKLTPGRFMAAIVDESHMLKDKSSKRTKALLPILKEAKFCVMLSGTPALARPRDLWPQLNILGCHRRSDHNESVASQATHGDGSWWQDEDRFLAEYVKGKNKRGKDKNFAQLHTLLTSTVMIRRTKSDMLKGLPPKKRNQVQITISDEQVMGEFKDCMRALRGGNGELGKIARAQYTAEGNVDDANEKANSAVVADPLTARRQVLNKLYSLTGKSKVPSIVSMLKKWLSDPTKGKVCIFAHHISVLNDIVSGAGLSNADGSTTKYIRIDGSTLPKVRQEGITTFQNDPTTRVAILGITAASVAVTLTAASTVWFAELFWTPAIMLQAEDRCHRIGQQNIVRCSYFFAKGSLDELLWKLVEQKYRDLGEFVEGRENSEITIHVTDIGDEDSSGEEKKYDDADVAGADLPALPRDEELQQDIVALGMEEEAMLKEETDDSDDGDGYSGRQTSSGDDVSPTKPAFDHAMQLPRMLLYKMDFAGNFGFVISPFQGRMVVKNKSSKRVQALGANVKPDVGDILVMVNGVYLPRNVEYRQILIMLKNALLNAPAELVFAEGGKAFRHEFCEMEGLSLSCLLQQQQMQICPRSGAPVLLSQARSYSMHFNGNYGIVIAPVHGRMVVRSKTPRRIQEFGKHSKPGIGDVLVAVNGEAIAPESEYTKVLMMLKYAMMQPPAELTFEENPVGHLPQCRAEEEIIFFSEASAHLPVIPVNSRS